MWSRLRSKVLKIQDSMIMGLRKMKIRHRLIAIVTIICVLPIVVVGAYSYNRYESSLTEKIGQTATEMLAQLNKNLSTELNRFTYIGDRLVTHELVQEELPVFDSLDELHKREIQLELNEFLNNQIVISEMVKGVYILDNNNQVFYSMGYDVVDPDAMVQAAEQAKKIQPLEYITAIQGPDENNNILFSRVIYSIDGSSEQKGVVLLVVDEGILKQKTYLDVKMGGNAPILLLNVEGIVMSSRDSRLQVGEPYPDQELLEKISENYKNKDYVFGFDFMGEPSTVVFQYQPQVRWYIVSLVPSGYINSEVSSINTGIVLLSLACILCSILVLSVVTASIDRPIKRLVALTNDVASGNFAISVEDDAKDEMGHLTRRFGEMVVQVEELRKKDEDTNRKKREMEIQMLQAQINPHFLFNTLNSLKWIAMMSRVRVVADGLDALAQLLRGTISEKHEWITLETEANYLEKYFFIQRLRYGDSFSVAYEIPEELKQALVIKFIFQPIVENAIIHGPRNASDKIHILIRAEKVNSQLQVLIEDDGQGFALKEKGQESNATENRKRLSGIGIRNVKERIEINFGPPYTMHIESEIGKGTSVRLIMPLLSGREDSECTKQ